MIVRYYVAASLDGYIATADGGLDWLKPYEAAESGYSDFMAGIGGLLMGRSTFDKMIGFGPWEHEDRPTAVLTNRALPDAPPGVETASGSVAAAIDRLRRRMTGGDIWLVGGGKVASQAASEGVLDQLELYSVPVVLQGGLPLFAPQTAGLSPFELVESAEFKAGLVRSVYRPRRTG